MCELHCAKTQQVAGEVLGSLWCRPVREETLLEQVGAMSATLYDLSSLPSTLSLISPAARRRQQTGDSVSLLQPEETQEKLKKCDKTEQNISIPTEKNILSTKNNSVKDKNFLRRLTRVSDEVSYRERRIFLACLQSQIQVNKQKYWKKIGLQLQHMMP